MKLLLQFNHQLPITLLQVFPKVLFDSVNGLPTHLANKEICLIKVSPHKSGCFPRYGFNLNAHFLAFACSFHSFMVNLQAGDHTKITELQAQHTCGVRGVGCKRREDIGYKGDCQITQDMSHLSVPLLWGPSGECPASPHLLELPLQRQWGLSC